MPLVDAEGVHNESSKGLMMTLNTRRIGTIAAGAAVCGAVLLGAIGASGGAGSSSDSMDPGSVQSKTPFTITNTSGQRLVYLKLTGHEEPPSNTQLLPGESATVLAGDSDDPIFKDDSGDVWFTIYGADGTANGTVDFHFDGTSVENSKATVYDTNGKVTHSLLDMSTGGSYTSWNVLDDSASGNTSASYTPGQDGWTQAQVSSMAKQLCTGSSQCSYDNVTTTSTEAAPVILAMGYNPNTSGDNNYIQAQTSAEVSSTTTWDESLSADAELMDVVTLGVSKTVGYSVTSSHTFATSDTAQVAEQTTEVIWGYAPMRTAAGDFTVRLGNTTLHLNGASFSVPDPQGAYGYLSNSYAGNQLDNPDLAPIVSKSNPIIRRH